MRLSALALGRVGTLTEPGAMLRRAAVALAVTTCAVAPAAAEDVITLKVSHLFNNELYLWKHGGQVFVDEAEKASNGRLKFEIYPSAQLGKDTVSTLESGLADIAIVVPSYSPDKLPLSSVAELPGMYENACDGSAKLWAILQPGGMLAEAEYAPRGLRPLFVNVLPAYHIVTTAKRAPENLAALSGLKLRANGNAMKKTVSALGAVPVQVPAPEMYDALGRGTVDGGLYSYIGIPDFGLQDHMKFTAEGPRLGAGSISYNISEASWAKLPEDLKQVMQEAALKAARNLCRWEETSDREVRDRIGLTVIDLPAEEIALWEEKVSVVVDSWLDDMKSAGKDGAVLVEAFRNADTGGM